MTALSPILIWASLVGSALMAGTFGVTAAGNVPLNTALANVDAHSDETGEVWARYVDRWTKCNHVRTLASVAATVCLALALR